MKTVVVCAAVLLMTVSAFASNEAAGAQLSTGRSTNITVESSELEPFMLERADESDERVQFYKSGDVVGGFNENGEPNIGARF